MTLSGSISIPGYWVSRMAIEVNTPVITSEGWTLAGLLKPGDYVFDEMGMPQEIKTIQVYDEGDCYEVVFDDGVSILADGNTTLPVENLNIRNIRSRGYKAKGMIKTIDEILEAGLTMPEADNRYRFSVKNTQPIQLPEVNLPVPPFIVGVWFTRTSNTPNLSVEKHMVNSYVNHFRRYGYNAKRVKREYDRIHLELRPNIQHAFLTKYPEKQHTIPDEYLISSEHQRIDLLRGIFFDKRHSYDKKMDVFRFMSRDYSLVKRIQGVVESLGIRTVMVEKKTGAKFRLFFRTGIPLIENQHKKDPANRFRRRFIRKITKIEPKKRIFVDTGGFFCIGEGFITLC